MSEEAQARLGKTSWLVLIFSLLADTAHIRSIPAYNSVIGAWGLYLSHCKIDAEEYLKKREEQPKIVRKASTFALITALSIIFDIVFCSTWGNEIFQGRYSSLKFTLIMLIFTMLTKVVSLFFTLLIMEANTAKDNSRKSSVEETRTTFDGVDEEEADQRSKRASSHASFNRSEPISHYQTEQRRTFSEASEKVGFQTRRPSAEERFPARRSSSLQTVDSNNRVPARRFSSLSAPESDAGSGSDNDERVNASFGPPRIRRTSGHIPAIPFSPGLPGLVSPYHMRPPGATAGRRPSLQG